MSAIFGPDDGSAPLPLYLLEVTVISAQDLHRRHRVRAYAVAWIDGTRRLRTDVDLAGGADPTWNDRFLFRVDAGFLKSETAAVVVEVRATRRLGADVVLGRTGIVVSTFVRARSPGFAAAPAVAALQLRHPRSLQPQGMLNVAVTLLGAAQALAVAPIYNMPGSPDAFAMKDLPAMRPAPPLCEITEEGGEAEARDSDHFARRQRPLVEHSGPLDPRGAAIEQSKLAMKLEKWRVDLSPDHGDYDGRGGGGRPGRWLRRSSCFFGRQESWER